MHYTHYQRLHTFASVYTSESKVSKQILFLTVDAIKKFQSHYSKLPDYLTSTDKPELLDKKNSKYFYKQKNKRNNLIQLQLLIINLAALDSWERSSNHLLGLLPY